MKMARSRSEDEDEAEDTISELMSQTMNSLKLVRSKQVRKLFPHMSKQFEDDLSSEFESNPYQPSDGANDYQDEDLKPPRTNVTAGATKTLVNSIAYKMGGAIPVGSVKKK